MQPASGIATRPLERKKFTLPVDKDSPHRLILVDRDCVSYPYNVNLF